MAPEDLASESFRISVILPDGEVVRLRVRPHITWGKIKTYWSDFTLTLGLGHAA